MGNINPNFQPQRPGLVRPKGLEDQDPNAAPPGQGFPGRNPGIGWGAAKPPVQGGPAGPPDGGGVALGNPPVRLPPAPPTFPTGGGATSAVAPAPTPQTMSAPAASVTDYTNATRKTGNMAPRIPPQEGGTPEWYGRNAPQGGGTFTPPPSVGLGVGPDRKKKFPFPQ